ncbi:MAG: GNAT family N-acetyltransferase [Rhodospirillales bacterium]
MTPPVLNTSRLRLEPLTEQHFPAFAAVLKDRETMSYYPHPFDDIAVKGWISRNLDFWRQHSYGRFAVIRQSDNQLLGDAGLMRLTVNEQEVNDIGWVIHRDHWGSGYASEAAAAVRDDAFDRLSLDALHANMPVDHPASRKVAEHIGMVEIMRFSNPKNRNIETHLLELTLSRYREMTRGQPTSAAR